MDLLTFALLSSMVIYGYLFAPTFFYIYLTTLLAYTITSLITLANSSNTLKNKILQSNFSDSGDPSIIGRLEVEMEKADEFLKSYNQKNPENKITLTSLALKCLGEANQGVNTYGLMSFGNFIQLPSVDIAVAVNIDDKNLFQYVARDCGRKGIKEIARDLKMEVKKLKLKKSKEYKHQMSVVKMMPQFLVKPILTLNRFLAYDLEMDIPVLKMKKIQYGNIVLSNIGPFDLKNCFAPNVPMCKSNFVMLMNSPEILPVVRDGVITTRKIMKLGITYDHRFIDGAQSVLFVKKALDVFYNPEKYL